MFFFSGEEAVALMARPEWNGNDSFLTVARSCVWPTV